MFHYIDPLLQKDFTFHLWPREVLFRKGAEADSFYLVISGKIMILKPFSAKIVREYGGGEVFGIPEVLLGEEWKFMAEAKTFSSICSFPKDSLFNRIEMMDSQPKKIMKYLLPQA